MQKQKNFQVFNIKQGHYFCYFKYEVPQEFSLLKYKLQDFILQIYIKMRRRSGAIHSETEQQFLQLAEQALETTGLFYDDKFNKMAKQSKNEQLRNPDKSTFDDFQFDVEKEYERYQKAYSQTQQKNISINVSSAIICDDIAQICYAISQQKEQQPSDKKGIDLVIRRRKNEKGKEFIFKYWVIQKQFSESSLSKVYISQAKRVYIICDMTEMQAVQNLKVSARLIKQNIEEEEQKFLNDSAGQQTVLI